MTPSRFEWAIAWTPIAVDESEGQTIVDIFERFKNAAKSTLLRDDSVPALAGSGIADD